MKINFKNPFKTYPSPNKCPTPCGFLVRMNALADFLFFILALLSSASAILLLGELWGKTRR